MSMLLAAAVGQAAMARPRFDHTEDVAVVARFIADTKAGKMPAKSIELINRDNPKAVDPQSFASYAKDCQLHTITAIASSSRRLPVQVEWDCGRFVQRDGVDVWEMRHASLWTENGRVVKVSWGQGRPVNITIPAAKAIPND